jgi:hypothetical protein
MVGCVLVRLQGLYLTAVEPIAAFAIILPASDSRAPWILSIAIG